MIRQKQLIADPTQPRLRLRGYNVVVDNGATTDAEYPDIKAGDMFIALPISPQCGVATGDVVICGISGETFAGADFEPGNGWIVIGEGDYAWGLSSIKTAISTLNNKFPISEADLNTSLNGLVAVSTADIDWSEGSIFTKTLTANTTLTFSRLDYALNKVITLLITGEFSLTLPIKVTIISGEYDGTQANYIQIHCVYVDVETPTNSLFWATISQENT